MATTVEEIIVRATLENQLSGPVRLMRNEVNALRRDLDLLGRTSVTPTIRLLNQLGQGAGGAGNQIGGLTRQTGSLNSVMGQTVRGGFAFVNFLGRDIVKGAEAGTLALTALGAAAVATGLKTQAQYEQTKIALNTLAGARGPEFFKFAQDYNLKTPYTGAQVNSVVQLLLASGVDPNQVKSLTQASGNLAASSGDLNKITSIGRVLGQVASAGKLYSQDINQLNNANVPVNNIIAENTGLPKDRIRQLLTTGQLTVPSSDFLGWLSNGSGPTAAKYLANGGLAVAANNTLSGAFSTAQDQARQRLAADAEPFTPGLVTNIRAFSGELGPFIDKIAPPLFGIVDRLSVLALKILPAATPVALAFFGGLEKVLDQKYDGAALLQLGGTTGASITRFFNAVAPDAPKFADALIAAAGVAPKLLDAFTQMEPVLLPIAEAFAKIASSDIGSQILGYSLLASGGLSVANKATGGAVSGIGSTVVQGLLLRRLLAGAGGAGGAGGLGGLAGAGGLLRGAGAVGLGVGGAAGIYDTATSNDPASAGGALKAALSGGSLGASVGLIGGPFSEISVPVGATIGAIGGGAYYGLKHWLGGAPKPNAAGGSAADVTPSIIMANQYHGMSAADQAWYEQQQRKQLDMLQRRQGGN